MGFFLLFGYAFPFLEHFHFKGEETSQHFRKGSKFLETVAGLREFLGAEKSRFPLILSFEYVSAPWFFA